MVSGKKKILSVSASESLRVTRHNILSQAGYAVTSFAEWHEFETACVNEDFNLVILGQSLTPSFKRDAAALIARHCPTTPILEIYIQEPTLENTAHTKKASSPLDPQSLLHAVADALEGER
jgi:DNA-binding NtrC family response regulator